MHRYRARARKTYAILSIKLSFMNFKTDSILKVLFMSLSLAWGGQGLSAGNPLTVKGVVSDQDNYPLAGAAIQIEGTSIGTMADEKGEFTISVEKGQV